MITYRKTHTYKYLLTKDYRCALPAELRSIGGVDTEFIAIIGGEIFITAGYRWDGPSGPTIDTKTFMRGSLVHDALYQLTREGHVPEALRKVIDKLLIQHCKEDGMNWLRRQMVYAGVRIGGGGSIEPEEYHEEVAP